MKIGTRSLLFGVHQFIYHPITVGLAWHKCYKRWPLWWEWIAIFCHDLGYWGKPNMDGEEGQSHPEFGADIAARIVFRVARLWMGFEYAADLSNTTHSLSLYHSTHYVQKFGVKVSALYLPDKMSVLFEPKWFYLLRGRLSGEIAEYVTNAPPIASNGEQTIWRRAGQWFDWYRDKIAEKWRVFSQSPERWAMVPKLDQYRIRHVNGLYAGYCHTVGDFMWTSDLRYAETYREGIQLDEEVRMLYQCGYKKKDFVLERLNGCENRGR